MQHPIQLDSAGGEYMDAVVILEWLRPVGAQVTAGEHIATVETAKAATEIEAPADGYLAEIRFAVGTEAPVGEVLGIIADSMAEVVTSGLAVAVPEPVVAVTAQSVGTKPDRIVASPLARRIAQQKGIELSGVTGTGPNGRIKRRDVEAAAAAVPKPSPVTAVAAPLPLRQAVPVVMIHGFGADRSSWRQVAGLLDARRQVILPELPGHGAALARPVADVQDLALAVADDLRATGVETAHLVGHSLGGAVAIALADQGLVSVRSLALIAPGGLGPEANIGFIRGLAHATTVEELEPWLETMVGDASALPSGMARAVLQARTRHGTGPALIALAEALFGEGGQKMRLGARLARLQMPAKVIWGLRDRIIPVAHADGLPGHVALHRLTGVGHVPQLEDPALVARLLDELHRGSE